MCGSLAHAASFANHPVSAFVTPPLAPSDGPTVGDIKMSGMFVFAAVLLLFLSTGASVQLDTSDGGYTELRVSISNSVTPEESIIGNIKALFRSSTEFLHKATNGRVYFKHVIIEVPKTWPKRNSSWAPSSNAYEKSDVLIDMPTPPYDDRPFTTQVKPCGEPGEFIHLTPGFLATLTNSTAKRFINPAYVFVHEWAHFRYGVFDNYGSLNDSRHPLTFCYNSTVRLNACSSRLVFSPRTAEGRLCSINEKCRLRRNCKVIIKQLEHDPVQSSIMFMPYVANPLQVSQFSDSRKGPCPHNPDAPNKQNEYCDQRSTWDVISKHEDFKNLPRPDMSKRIELTFDEAQEDQDLPQRVVLVLDVSKSMRGSRIGLLKEVAEQYIEHIEDGSRRLAIVTFSSNSTVVHTLKTVNMNTRQGFLNAFRKLGAQGDTCIGCGLKAALKAGSSFYFARAGSYVFSNYACSAVKRRNTARPA
ncbi:calcium-activated chloride channel regulator 1-like [Amblyomma americanum]